MTRTLLLVLLIGACLSAQEPTFKRRFHSPPIPQGAVVPPPNPECTITQPTNSATYATSISAITIGGACVDQDGIVESVLVTCSTCTPTSVQATLTSSTGAYQAAFTAQTEGPNVFGVVGTDNNANDSTEVTLTSSYVVADAEDPVVTIESPNGGNNFNDDESPVLIAGSCADDVGCTAVTWANATTGGSGSCAGTSSWSCSVTVEAGSNVITITGVNDADGSGQDAITATIVFPLAWTTPATLGTVTIAATTRQLTCTGGSGSITYAEVGDNLGDGELASTGVLTYPDVEDTYTFTVRCTDGAATEADREFALIVDDSAEGPHAYFEQFCDDDVEVHENAFFCESLRDARRFSTYTQNSLSQWAYVFPGAADTAACSGGVCNDDFSDPQDAVKLVLTPNENAGMNLPGSDQMKFPGRLSSDLWSQFDCDAESFMVVFDWYWDVTFRANQGAINNWKWNQVVLAGTDWWTMNLRKTDDPDPSVGGRHWDSFRSGPWPASVNRREPYDPSGLDTWPQHPQGAAYTLALNKWNRIVLEIQPCQPHTAFTDWNAAGYPNTPLEANPNDSQGRWHMVSKWVIDEDRDAQRILYRAPVNWGAQNEIQDVNLGDIGTGDSFTLGFGAETTSAISFSADMSSAIEDAIEALTGVGSGDITATKVTGHHSYAVNFGGSLANSNVAALVLTPTGFTPAADLVTLGNIAAGDTYTLTYNGETTGTITFQNNMSGQIDAALEALPGVGVGGVTLVEKIYGEQIYRVSFTAALAGAITITDPVGFTQGTPPGVLNIEQGGGANPDIVRFRFEHNSSKQGGIGPWIGYGRNLVVFRNYSLPASDPENDAVIFQRPVR